MARRGWAFFTRSTARGVLDGCQLPPTAGPVRREPPPPAKTYSAEEVLTQEISVLVFWMNDDVGSSGILPSGRCWLSCPPPHPPPRLPRGPRSSSPGHLWGRLTCPSMRSQEPGRPDALNSACQSDPPPSGGAFRRRLFPLGERRAGRPAGRGRDARSGTSRSPLAHTALRLLTSPASCPRAAEASSSRSPQKRAISCSNNCH